MVRAWVNSATDADNNRGLTMPAGRPRKPTNLKILEGNAGKRKLDPVSEPQPDDLVDLRPPAFLLPEAKKVWNEYAPKLVKLNLLKEIDSLEFAILCQSWALMLKSEATIKKEGIVCTSKLAGAKYQHPAMGNRSQLIKQISTLCHKFGMSASARSGLHLTRRRRRRLGRQRGHQLL
jgi:P27 family predicted phage terminase small subunit